MTYWWPPEVQARGGPVIPTEPNNVMCCAVSVDARLSVNVALNRASYQSSTYHNGGSLYYAANANDGHHDTNLQNGSCAHTTRETNPWWAVDLGVPLYVYGVNFTNRHPSCTYVMFHVDLTRKK